MLDSFASSPFDNYGLFWPANPLYSTGCTYSTVIMLGTFGEVGVAYSESCSHSHKSIVYVANHPYFGGTSISVPVYFEAKLSTFYKIHVHIAMHFFDQNPIFAPFFFFCS